MASSGVDKRKNHHQLMETVEVFDRRLHSVNGKEIIVRTRSSSLSGRSIRRRIASDPKYQRLEGPSNKTINGIVDLGLIRTDDDINQNRQNVNKTTAKKSSVLSVGEILDSVKRGMSTFGRSRMPRNHNNNKIPKKEEVKVDGSIDHVIPAVVVTQSGSSLKEKKFWDKNKRNRRANLMVSASTIDITKAAGSIFTPPAATADTPATLNQHRLPGISGIRNHGNTCYMNSVLQCLCHTDSMAKYFVMDQYKMDISRRNKYNSKKYGSCGEVTEQLALLFKSLWSSQYTPDISNQFRNVVGKYASQYQGGNQQDAQEFLMWLLDKVHEDLNTATKKKYKKVGNNNDRSEEEMAAEAMANYARCNNSFIHDLFQAQYRSTLTCPACHKQSITFDPFLCISTPIPQKQMRPIYVTVVYQDQQPKQVKIGLRMNTEANIRELKEAVASDTGIPFNQLILIELYQDNFGRVFKDSDHVSTVQETPVYAMEIPAEPPADSQPQEQLLILGLNKLGYGNNAKRFGGPFAIRVQREIGYHQLQSAVFKGMVHILKEDAMQCNELDSIIRFRVVDGIPGKCYLPDDVQLPLYMPTVDKAMSSAEGQHLSYLKLSVEWDADIREKKVNQMKEMVEEHQSVAEVKSQQNELVTATLADCFDLYTQEEQLELENKWLCPSCKKLQQGVKKLSLWSMPEVLVIHLKRFRQTNNQRTKLDTLVDFPIQDLNMSPHIVNNQNGHSGHAQSNSVFSHWSPWKQPHRTPLFRSDCHVFDLYAICNHQGSMQSGHYTAYCKNPIDGLWYHFDDNTVRQVDDNSIVTTSAYILFYQRRPHSSGSSSESSSCATWPDHWAYNMPHFHFIPPKTSKSHDNLFDLDYGLSSRATLKERSFLRGGRKYSTLGALSGRRNKHNNENKCPSPSPMPESSV